MRVIFAGSPEPAVPVLRALVDSHHEVVLVVTREDRPKGRSKTPVPTPVGAVAEELGIPTLKPSSINTPESLQVLRDADVPAPTRDEFLARQFPDDIYDLSPAAFAEIDPALHEAGLMWGAAKAHVHLARRRAHGSD